MTKDVLLLYHKNDGPYIRCKINNLNMKDGVIYFQIGSRENSIKIDELEHFEISKITPDNRWMIEVCGTCELCVPKMGGPYYCNEGPDVDDNYNWSMEYNHQACSGWKERK
jgi:hypothetical protein